MGNSWVLPGGRLEINEKTSYAVLREFQEELGFQLKVKRLLWMIENFNAYGNQNLHEFGVYYLLEAEEPQSIICETGEFQGIEEDVKLTFRWFGLEQLQNITLYPKCLKELLKDLEHEIKHVVNDDSNL
jgi:8-oxo-dGTP pyrophosphatase MutT (NUDIX family)